MAKWAVAVAAIIIYGFLCYQLGSSNQEIKIVTREVEGKIKEVEVIKYETKYEIKEICSIMAKPNLNDNDIIRLYDTEQF